MNDNESLVRTITGKVVSVKMNKSITIEVERIVAHPVYGKFIKRTTKLMVHDEGNSCVEGDIVVVRPCRPRSKNKTWILLNIIGKSK
jgi:small subunit ribosomal protein S17